MHACKDPSFVYIRVPWTGSTTLIYFLQKNLGKKFRRLAVHAHETLVPEKHRDRPRLAFVRNPVTRLPYGWMRTCYLTKSRMSFSDWMTGRAGSQFVGLVTLQMEFMVRVGHVDCLFHLENISEEMRGLDFWDQLRHRRPILEKDRSWVNYVAQNLLTKNDWDLVMDGHREDFHAFGYDCELPEAAVPESIPPEGLFVLGREE